MLGYGFAIPYLRAFQIEAERTVSFMPAQQGVVVWPESRPLSVLGEEDALPFPDAMYDRILVVHGLEGADAVRPLMRQLWRVLAPRRPHAGGRAQPRQPVGADRGARPSPMAARSIAASSTGCCAAPCSSRCAGTARSTARR